MLCLEFAWWSRKITAGRAAVFRDDPGGSATAPTGLQDDRIAGAVVESSNSSSSWSC